MHPRPEVFAILAVAALAGKIAAWGGLANEPVGGVEGRSTGAATFEITNAPPRAMCVRITVAGNRTDVRLFPLVGEVDAKVEVEGLPAGRDTLSAESFAVPCALVSDGMTPNAHSEPTVAPISAGDTARLDLVMIRDDEARVATRPGG